MKGKKTVPKSEETAEKTTPAERFVKTATTRVNAVLADLTKVGKLNTNTYEYTPEQVEQILSAIRSKVDKVEQILLGAAEVEQEFSLS